MNIRTTAQRARLALCYKNFGAVKGLSHIGLGVSAMHNAKMLRAAGYMVDLTPITSAADLTAKLNADAAFKQHAHHVPLTHVVISAPWLATNDLLGMVSAHPDIKFVVVSHSNIGFLQADPQAFKLLRECGSLAASYDNFFIAGNSAKLSTWWRATYGVGMLTLPNMYWLDGQPKPKRWPGHGSLKIGCFCAVRPYKNVLTAAAAALEIGVRMRVSDLEFWMSGGRMEGGGDTIFRAITEMYAGMPRSKVVQNNWEAWPQFVKTVGSMDLLMQPSYTESFNVSVADGISEGLPSVISDAIDWAPKRWQAEVDNASGMADVGISLLHDPNAAHDGYLALTQHNQQGMRLWTEFLQLNPVNAKQRSLWA